VYQDPSLLNLATRLGVGSRRSKEANDILERYVSYPTFSQPGSLGGALRAEDRSQYDLCELVKSPTFSTAEG